MVSFRCIRGSYVRGSEMIAVTSGFVSERHLQYCWQHLIGQQTRHCQKYCKVQSAEWVSKGCYKLSTFTIDAFLHRCNLKPAPYNVFLDFVKASVYVSSRFELLPAVRHWAPFTTLLYNVLLKKAKCVLLISCSWCTAFSSYTPLGHESSLTGHGSAYCRLTTPTPGWSESVPSL